MPGTLNTLSTTTVPQDDDGPSAAFGIVRDADLKPIRRAVAELITSLDKD